MTAAPDRLGWGLMGASDIGATWMIHAIRSQPDSEVVAVLSRSLVRAAEYAGAHGIPAHYTSLEAFLADPRVDVVYVASDNRLHRGHAVAAARAGKAVLCEKPLATTVADAREMVAACREAGVVMGRPRRTRPDRDRRGGAPPRRW